MDYKELFDFYIQVAAIANNLVFNDVQVGIFDRNKLLYFKPGKYFELPSRVGDVVKPSMGVYRAMQEKRRIVDRFDKSIFGKPYISVASPILTDSGDVVGAVSIIQSTDRQEEMKNIANLLGNSVSALASTTEEISAQTQEAASTSQFVAKVTKESAERVKEIYKVLDLIKNMASQTNLIGLNAAIEAARVGDLGGGFSVVADEIRKLSFSSANSIQSVTQMIKTIQNDSQNINDQINRVESVIEEIAQAISNVAANTQEINLMFKKLDQIANSLSQDAKSEDNILKRMCLN